MQIFSHVSAGFEGFLIQVEVFIRRGIPAVDIVGLPDGAVREAKERIRVAILQSGFQFPSGRILINLAPADIRKEGASFDLSLALSVLSASGQINDMLPGGSSWLVLGELELSGRIRAVKGTLPAVAAALKDGVSNILVPPENLPEAQAAGRGNIYSLDHLQNLSKLKNTIQADSPNAPMDKIADPDNLPDLKDLKGQAYLKRALMVAAAGGHHMLLFGPPGSGKTLAANCLEGLLPPLASETSHEVSRIWSQAGKLGRGKGMITRPPFRTPHHSATMEGLIGGGVQIQPGEISLAHGGVLFLDETPEFQGRILQSLREPLENGKVTIVRAGQSYWYPSRFQLVMAANPCPCGNLGKPEAVCICSHNEIQRYWKKVGGALMDRIDIRIPVEPVSPEVLLNDQPLASAELRVSVVEASDRQAFRYKEENFRRNRDIPVGKLGEYCFIRENLQAYFTKMARFLGLSSRACHSVLKVARTIADLSGHDDISQEDLEEAGQYRRYGDSNFFWN
ncbi:MAG: hypothetical protein B6241_04325 [Spirochaetaceae bacterium 4572_59]|nr:MAG: hypothetical protein B6241_04325 [Spirochaetaceae bacterium 4572_59]